MLDSLLDMLAELLGLGGGGDAESAPRRARPKQEGGAAAPGQAPEQRKAVTLADVFRQMMGVEEETGEAPPPPRQIRREERPRPPARERRPLPETPAPALRPRPPAPQPVAAAAPPAPGAQAPEFAAALRGNPEAARRAFVYSEIFGPPAADRSPR